MNLIRYSVFAVVFAATAVVCSAQDTVHVPLLTETQKAYQRMPRADRIVYFADKEKRKELAKDGYFPLPAKVILPFTSGTFVFSESGASQNTVTTVFGKITVFAPSYVLVTLKNGTLELQNLKIAMCYSWCMESGKEKKSGLIQTEDIPPRLMRIPGIPNARDLGGRIGLDGRRVKQGMVYRSAGLNDYAGIYDPYDLDDFLKEEPTLAEKLAPYLEKEKQLKAELKAGAKPDSGTLEYTLSHEWIVFHPSKVTREQLTASKDWKEIPDEFLGAKPEVMKANEDGAIVFPGVGRARTAIFAQVFEALADGVIRIGFAADSFLCIYINGEPVFDRLQSPCGKKVLSKANYQLDIKVRKGKNLVVCPVVSGDVRFGLCMGPYNAVYAELLEVQKDINRAVGRRRIRPETRNYLVSRLNLKSDVDLRNDNEECFCMTGSPAGNTVKWFHYSSRAYADIQDSKGRAAFANVFKVFLDESNYPIVFHCVSGQDRTGAVAFILNGLLGVEEEQLYLDWESTGYWNRSNQFNHKNLFNKLVNGFDKFPGKTINERIEAYVLSLGFTKQDIDLFRNIMLEKK